LDTETDRFYATSSLVVGNKFVTIPLDLRFIRSVQLTDSDGNQLYLEQRDTSFMFEYYATPGTVSVDIPKYFANWDEEFWVVAPTPDKAYVITLGYNKEPGSITSTTEPTTNAPFSTVGTYLSNKYQDVLLYACLVQAYSYTKGPSEMMQFFEASYKQAIQGLGIEQQGRRRRDEYRDGIIRIPLRSESPGP